MMNDQKKLLEYMSEFYKMPALELKQKYTMGQLEDAYNEINQKTRYQKHLDDKRNFSPTYLMKEFSPL